jgi:hypothetical protein
LLEILTTSISSQRLEELVSDVAINPYTSRASKKLLTERYSARKLEIIPRTTCSWNYFASGYGQALGLKCSVVEIQSEKEKDFSLHIRSELPYLGIALQLQCHLIFPWCGSISFYGNGGLPRIIPDESEYLEACRRGDLSFVRELFRNGIARPEDTSKANMTPLLVSHPRIE